MWRNAAACRRFSVFIVLNPESAAYLSGNRRMGAVRIEALALLRRRRTAPAQEA
jgi:hypothetical protein